jgi:N-hydroxyarylamine O-acetyltransferase
MPHDTDMNLAAYFKRIGYNGQPQLNHATLAAIHRAHLTSIAYENLDIHLGHTIGLDLEHIYDKIVRRGRGGWCYEMNSLLAWALHELGFEVTMLGAAVAVSTAEERQHLDHMALLVTLDEPWLLDVGFGNAFLEPIPLQEGTHHQAYHTYQLQRDGDYWCFANHIHGGPGFDFLLEPRTIESYTSRCIWQQTAPESGFVKRTVCHRFYADHSIQSLRGAVLTTVTSSGKAQHVVTTLAEYQQVLTTNFGLVLTPDEIRHLWEKVWAAHLVWESSPISMLL